MNVKKKMFIFTLIFALFLIPITYGQADTSVTTSTNNSQNNTKSIGWKKENDSWYYYKADYTKAFGWNKIDNVWYYLNKDTGKMATGWLYDNTWYYLDNSGAMSVGWKLVDNKWYLLDSSGAMETGIKSDGANLYYLKSSGEMANYIDWQQINSKWYYFEPDGKIKTGWLNQKNTWYYLQNDGSMITGLNTINGKKYMFNTSGAMVTGWSKSGNNLYYFNIDGSMANGWILDNEKYYYIYSDGTMAKGWLELNGEWYYLNSDGVMATGWITSSGSKYYLDKNTGKMVTNTTIDGYEIGADGKGVKKTNPVQPTTPSPTPVSTNPVPITPNPTPTTPVPSTPISSKDYYYGIDVSNNNGFMNFDAIKASGVELVYMKATEGTTYIDTYLDFNYNSAVNAGLKVGFYHYLVGTSDPETQADNFYNSIKDKTSDLKPMLDVESSNFDVMDYTLRFINEFKKLSNMDIGIYTYSSFIGENLDGRLSEYPLWEANYNNTPLENLPVNSVWFSRVGHQYTDSGVVNGINGNVDLDRFTKGIFLK